MIRQPVRQIQPVSGQETETEKGRDRHRHIKYSGKQTLAKRDLSESEAEEHHEGLY